jgi:hypothetical protein
MVRSPERTYAIILRNVHQAFRKSSGSFAKFTASAAPLGLGCSPIPGAQSDFADLVLSYLFKQQSRRR